MLTIKNVNGKIGIEGYDLMVDFPALAAFPNISEAAIELGIINKLRDCHASISKPAYAAMTAEERGGRTLAEMKIERVNKTLIALMKGEWAIEGLPRATDPVAKEAKKLAIAWWNNLAKDWDAKTPNEKSRVLINKFAVRLGVPMIDYKASAEKMLEQHNAIMGQAVASRIVHPEVQATAKANVEKAKEVTDKAISDADIDAELGLTPKAAPEGDGMTPDDVAKAAMVKVEAKIKGRK